MSAEKRMREIAPAPTRATHVRGDSGEDVLVVRRGTAAVTRLSARGKTVLTPKGFPMYL